MHITFVLNTLSLSLSPLILSPLSFYLTHAQHCERSSAKRYVFSCFFNVVWHLLCLMCIGSEIQVVGSNTEKDFFPKGVVRELRNN